MQVEQYQADDHPAIGTIDQIFVKIGVKILKDKGVKELKEKNNLQFFHSFVIKWLFIR